jgi:hypothetical protein
LILPFMTTPSPETIHLFNLTGESSFIVGSIPSQGTGGVTWEEWEWIYNNLACCCWVCHSIQYIAFYMVRQWKHPTGQKWVESTLFPHNFNNKKLYIMTLNQHQQQGIMYFSANF